MIGFRRRVPCMFEVDVSELRKFGELNVGQALVEEDDAEVVDPESPWKAKYIEFAERMEHEHFMAVLDEFAGETHPAKYPREVLERLRNSEEISETQFNRLVRETRSALNNAE